MSSYDPLSQKFRPAPATRSVTTLETRTSLGSELRHYPCCGVDRDTSDVSASNLEFACVEASPDG